MKSFSFYRFSKTLRWVLSVNRRMVIGVGVTIMAITFLTQLLYLQLEGSNVGVTKMSLRFLADFMTMPIIVVTAFYASSVGDIINKRPDREAFLMLPAANLEKYLSLLFFVTVAMPLCTFVGYAAGDLLRIGVAPMTGESQQSTVPMVLANLTPANGRHWLPEISFILLMIVWIHSFYILGGTWLRKYAYGIVTLLLIATPLLAQYVFLNDGERLNLFVTYNGVSSVNPLVYVLDVLFVVFSVLNYWASFHIFKNFQLITNKWTNYDFHKR